MGERPMIGRGSVFQMLMIVPKFETREDLGIL
jgi:hypothetical protein